MRRGQVMLKLAIVDDEMIQSDEIFRKVEEWQKCNKLLFEIKSFLSGEELLKYLKIEENMFDIVFLDMKMERMTGVETAIEIRKNSQECIIIFVTNYLEPVCESFKVGAFRYILKKDIKNAMFEALDSACKIIKDEEKFFSYFSNKQEVKILCKKIVCLESIKRIIRITINDNSCKDYYGKLSEVEITLTNYNFVRCHQSFIVNVGYIDTLEGNTIFLNNGMRIPVSNRYIENVKNAVIWVESFLYNLNRSRD